MSRKNLQQKKQKEALIEQLRKTPIIQIAVEKCGVSRAIYYVWRKQDVKFAKAADQAISEGVLYINDLSESQLISLIKDEDIQSIRFWLTHRHPSYAAKLQIDANVRQDEAPSPKQALFIKRTLSLLEAMDKEQSTEEKDDHEQKTG